MPYSYSREKLCPARRSRIIYIYCNGKAYISTDYETKKLRNLKENPKAAVVVDDINPNRGVLIWGKASIIEKGDEYRKIYKIFYEKFEWVRLNPWKEGEAPFIRIEPSGFSSWGLK